MQLGIFDVDDRISEGPIRFRVPDGSKALCCQGSKRRRNTKGNSEFRKKVMILRISKSIQDIIHRLKAIFRYFSFVISFLQSEKADQNRRRHCSTSYGQSLIPPNSKICV